MLPLIILPLLKIGAKKTLKNILHQINLVILMQDIEALKKEAGIKACEYVQNGMKVGLGTGSTVKYTIIELARRIIEEGLEITGVPTSLATKELAESLGISLIELDQTNGLDIVIDGADEFDPSFQLIKGGGAALLREKIVAQASNKMVVVADDRKQVTTLGQFPLPIEINLFCAGTTVKQIEKLLNCDVKIRKQDGKELKTDNGNLIADAFTGPKIADPVSIETDILKIAGVVQVGLFNNMCDVVIVAGKNGVEVLEKQ